MARMTDWRSLGRHPDTIRIRSRWGVRPLVMTLGGALMSAVCVWVMFAHDGPGFNPHPITPVTRAIALFGALFFGAASIMTLLRTLRGDGGLTLSPEGITDHTTLVSVGLVRWDEMTGAVPATTLGVGFVGIAVRDPRAVLARSGPRLQAARRANLNFGGLNTPAWINTEVLPIDASALAALINDYHEAWRLDHGVDQPALHQPAPDRSPRSGRTALPLSTGPRQGRRGRNVTIGRRHDRVGLRTLRLWAASLICLLLAVGSVLVTHHLGLPEAALLLLAVLAPFAAHGRTGDSHTWVRLTPTALVDAVSPAERCQVAWSMVTDVVTAPDAGEVQLIVHDPAGMLERLPQVERLDGSPNRIGLMGDPWVRVRIPAAVLGTDPATLAARIREHWQSARRTAS